MCKIFENIPIILVKTPIISYKTPIILTPNSYFSYIPPHVRKRIFLALALTGWLTVSIM